MNFIRGLLQKLSSPVKISDLIDKKTIGIKGKKGRFEKLPSLNTLN